MKGFDLIDSASFGYKTVWQERKYLIRLAMVPVLIKLISTVVIFSLGYEDDYIKQGLISLPAAFAEGWLLAQFLRTLLMQERWPIMVSDPITDSQMSALLLRARGIMASTILFALITFLAYGFKEIYLVFYNMSGGNLEPDSAAAEQAAANPIYLIPAFLLIVASVWVFRYMWLYIPAAVLMPLGEFLKKIGGIMASIRMMGVFLVSVMPCMILAVLVSNIVAAIVGGADSDIGRFSLVIVSVIFETLISVLTTAAMAYALRYIVPKHPSALPDIGKE